MAELAIGIAGLGGTIDVCIKWGNALVQACKVYKEADSKLGEMIVRIQVCWTRVVSQLEVIKELEYSMKDEDKSLQRDVLCILRGKLELATEKFSKFDDKPAIMLSVWKKVKFALLKDTLEEILADLEFWEKRHQPSFFQLVKHAPPTVDVTLNNVIKTGSKAAAESSLITRQFRRAFKEPSGESQSVFIRAEELQRYDRVPIPFCTSMLFTRPGDSRQLIVDVVTNGAVQSKDARGFARRLRQSDPFVFGLFSCKGVVRQPVDDKSAMAFLFRVPEGYSDIRSIRQLLLSGQVHDSLSDRFEMAKQLAKAVYYVHLYGFVHKNIHPETIVTLGKTEQPQLPSMAFLVGFQVIRNADGRTYPVADMKWETNLYRHPLRQGDHVDYFVMQHDIYSLGVCLLEIGLWESFITYNADGIAQPSTALFSAAEDDNWQQVSKFDPLALKNHLASLSRSETLRARMGTRYSRVVETCLTCLDADNLDFGDEQEFQDEDGVEVGVRYIEKVLGILNSICI